MDRRRFLSLALTLPLAGCGLRSGLQSRTLERLGASTACLAGYTLLDSFAELRRLGFDTVEIIAYTGASHSVGEIPGFAYHDASPREREQVFESTRAFRHISFHLPFVDVSLFSPSPERRRAGLDQIHQGLDGLAYLGGELAVMHLGWPEAGLTYRDIWRSMLDTLRALGDYAGERGIRIGLETMQPASIAEYTELIFAVDHPAVGATIDTGHIRGASDIGLQGDQRFTEEGRVRFNDVLDALMDSIRHKAIHVHLSDVRPSDWVDHRTVGSGVIDFPRFFRALERMDYEGLLVFELEEPDRIGSLVESRRHVEQILARRR